MGAPYNIPADLKRIGETRETVSTNPFAIVNHAISGIYRTMKIGTGFNIRSFNINPIAYATIPLNNNPCSYILINEGFDLGTSSNVAASGPNTLVPGVPQVHFTRSGLSWRYQNVILKIFEAGTTGSITVNLIGDGGIPLSPPFPVQADIFGGALTKTVGSGYSQYSVVISINGIYNPAYYLTAAGGNVVYSITVISLDPMATNSLNETIRISNIQPTPNRQDVNALVLNEISNNQSFPLHKGERIILDIERPEILNYKLFAMSQFPASIGDPNVTTYGTRITVIQLENDTEQR